MMCTYFEPRLVLLQMYGHFDEESALQILRQLLNVLVYLHRQVKFDPKATGAHPLTERQLTSP